MSADDVTQRAARIINESNWKADFKGGARADEIAQALADAGLLATPEHDRAVAARALREAAEAIGRWHADYPITMGCEALSRDEVLDELEERADRIEAGETDA